jgi:hypothetical protein
MKWVYVQNCVSLSLKGKLEPKWELQHVNALIFCLYNEWTCIIVNQVNGYALRNVIVNTLVIKYDELQVKI